MLLCSLLLSGIYPERMFFRKGGRNETPLCCSGDSYCLWRSFLRLLPVTQLTLFSPYLYQCGWLDIDGSSHPVLSETQLYQREEQGVRPNHLGRKLENVRTGSGGIPQDNSGKNLP